jgi:hypothetical protein
MNEHKMSEHKVFDRIRNFKGDYNSTVPNIQFYSRFDNFQNPKALTTYDLRPTFPNFPVQPTLIQNGREFKIAPFDSSTIINRTWF